METIGPQKLAASIFEAVLEEACLNENSEIVMPERNGKIERISAKQVKEKYSALYDQWQETYGAGFAFKAMMAKI